MENYTKGENIEETFELANLPFNIDTTNVMWLKVKPGSKMNSFIDVALTSFGEGCEQHIWSGIGPAIGT